MLLYLHPRNGVLNVFIESTTNVSFAEKCSDPNVTKTVLIVVFAIFFVVTVFLGVTVGLQRKKIQRSLIVGLCSVNGPY